MGNDRLSFVVELQRPAEEARSGVDRSKWIAQIVPENRDELLAQLRRLALVEQGCFAGCQALLRLQVEADEIGKQPEHPHHVRRLQLRRLGIDGAERAEEGAIAPEDRHGNIALESVHPRCGVTAKILIRADVVDCHRQPGATDFVADGRFDLEFATRLQSERDIVTHGTRDPPVFGHTRNGREAHACDPAHHIEHGRNHVDPRNRSNVSLQIDHMRGPPLAGP